MARLSPPQLILASLLNRLNQSDMLLAWKDECMPQQELEDWQSGQDNPMDTTFSALRTSAIDWLQRQLDGLLDQSASRTYPPQWISVNDFFCHTGKDIYAFRLGDWVLQWQDDHMTWIKRKWLGREDPLLALPYSRKYDIERHQVVDRRLMDTFERMQRASDLVNMLRGRIAAHDVREGWSWPLWQDLADELARDDFGVGMCSLSAMCGAVRVEFLGIEDLESPVLLFAHSYSGAFTQLRSPSASAMKRMLLDGIDGLSVCLDECIQTVYCEE